MPGECVKVVVRCRPLTEKEKAAGYNEIVEMADGRVSVTLSNGSLKEFSFDDVYDWNSRQRDLYERTFKGLVDSVMQGFNGTIFAYGQTGTGKTFTMQGVRNDAELQGVIPNSFGHIFNYIAESSNEQYLVRASFLEIYMEEIRDLLSRDQSKRLELKERPDCGVYVKDLSSFVTKNEKEIQQIMDVGNKNRSVGSTNMNEQSSRSHAIFIITIECSLNDSEEDAKKKYKVGKLNLVDLAGSERQSKTGAEGERLKEANKINLSLSTLGMVISALVEKSKSHIPYRDSKLTRLLQDSLGGNAKTIMVANIGPASYNLDESLTTLRYASNAKKVKNSPKINEDPKDALLRRFQEEIRSLQAALQGSGRGEGTEKEMVAKEEESFKEEREKILNNKMLIEEEKKQLLSHLSAKEEALLKERETQEQLVQQIAKMESKLLSGNIIDHTNQQQQALEFKRKQIAEEQEKEQEMKRKLLEEEESALNLAETYNSYQQEADAKTKKLKKLFSKLQSSKTEIKQLQETNASERHDLENTLNDLIRELKLRSMIVENFIPTADKRHMTEGLEYDEEKGVWKALGGFSRKPPRAPSPICHLNRPYDENILQVDLELPMRSTRDYEDPVIAPKIQGLLSAALAGDKELEVVSHLK